MANKLHESTWYPWNCLHMKFMRSILSSQFVRFSSKVLLLESKDSTFTTISGHQQLQLSSS